MKYAHLATRLYNAPLLITPEKAAVIEGVFRAYVEGRPAIVTEVPEDMRVTRIRAMEAQFSAQGMQRAEGGYWRANDRVALLPVVGSLMQRGDSLDAMSGLVGYNRIAAQLQAAVDDYQIDAILLEFDSPGGEGNGVMDLASKIAAAAKKKPTWAIANEQAFSAAYWLASAASRVHAPQTGMVGSIGVVMLHQDQSVKDAKAGVAYTAIYAGDRKADFSSHAPLSDEARAVAQDRVDELYGLFVDAVAAQRGIDAEAVRETQAGLLNAKAAKEHGFVDDIALFDETLAALGEEARNFRIRGRTLLSGPATSTDQGADDMPEAQKTFTAEDLAKARAEGKAEGKAEAEASANAAAKTQADAAAKAAQDRIAAILGHESAKGREAQAKHLAFNTQLSVEDAAAILAAAPKAETAKADNPLAAAMKQVPNPSVGIAGAASEDAPRKVMTSAELFARRNKQAGVR